MTRSDILNALLKPLIQASGIVNQFGREFSFDEAFLSRLLSGKSNVPTKISRAAARELSRPKKGKNAYRLYSSLHPFADLEEPSSRLLKAIVESPSLSVNEKERMKQMFKENRPSFFERAFLLSLLSDNRLPGTGVRSRGRPAKAESHPDYRLLSPEERKTRARLFLARLNRRKRPLEESDLKEFFAILRFEAFPFGPQSRKKTLRSLLMALPKTVAIEPLLAFEMRLKKELLSFTPETREKASLFLSLIEPLGAELKFQELKDKREKAALYGESGPLLDEVRKTVSAFYWRKSSPTFLALLASNSYLDDPRLLEGIRKALGEAFAPLKG